MVNVPVGEVVKGFNAAFNTLAQRVSLPGFRRGRVPMSHIRKRYGNQVASDVTNDLVKEGWRKALAEHDLSPMGEPEIEAVPAQADHEYTFSFTVEVRPQFELSGYEGIPASKITWKVTDTVIEEQLRRIARESGTWEAITDRDVIQLHDTVVIDYVGTVDTVPFKGGEAKDESLIVGGGVFPDLEAQLIGKKVNEPFDIETPVPDVHPNKEVAGRPAVFSGVAKEIRVMVPVPIDDELAKRVGTDSVETLRESVAQSIVGYWNRATEEQFFGAIKQHLIQGHQFDVPPNLVGRSWEAKKADLFNELVKNGTQPDEAMQRLEREAESLQAQVADEIKLGIIFDAIAEKEEISIDEREVNLTVSAQAQAMGRLAEHVKELYNRPDQRALLRRRLLQDKVLEFLGSKASVNEVERDIPSSTEGHRGTDDEPEADTKSEDS